MIKLCVFLLLQLILNIDCWANLYTCDSPKSQPELAQDSSKNELIISTFPPMLNSNQVNRDNLEYKKPFLIYYAVDSTEAFMQISVKYEIAKLQRSCKSNKNVNFIAFINSLYVAENSFIYCKNKVLKQVNFEENELINRSLNQKRMLISKGEESNSKFGSLNYKVRYSKESTEAFKAYPLAHPDFLFDLINFATSNQKLFPIDKFAPFLNLKSHGSEDYILSGMHSCQAKAKELSAKKIINTILSSKEIMTLESLNTPSKIEKNLKTYENIISKLDLGSSRGVGSFKTKNDSQETIRLGEQRLSITDFKIGSAFGGLGVSQGLGSDYGFGTNQIQLGWVLDDLYPHGSNRSLGFMILESCESKRNPSLFYPYMDNILGYYTALKSLWYRNLNWWEILEKADGSTGQLFFILKEETAKIPNIEVVTK
jgi:hypothetical protein